MRRRSISSAGGSLVIEVDGAAGGAFRLHLGQPRQDCLPAVESTATDDTPQRYAVVAFCCQITPVVEAADLEDVFGALAQFSAIPSSKSATLPVLASAFGRLLVVGGGLGAIAITRRRKGAAAGAG